MKPQDLYCIVILTLLFLLLVAAAADIVYGQVPLRASKYKRDLIREVQAIWGITQDPSIFAAQIHAESRWKPHAQSAYASGLGQQTPNTVKWLNELDPQLSAMIGGAFNPQWSIRALVYYDKWLHRRIDVDEIINRWAFALHGYNAGLGWTMRERRSSIYPEDYFCSVRDTCLRSQSNCNQTRAYVEHILWDYWPMYQEAGW
jgi:soluble lytic murein transglycosylase-like protein